MMASELAARLEKLVSLYGDNPVQIEGHDVRSVWLMDGVPRPYFYFETSS